MIQIMACHLFGAKPLSEPMLYKPVLQACMQVLGQKKRYEDYLISGINGKQQTGSEYNWNIVELLQNLKTCMHI